MKAELWVKLRRSGMLRRLSTLPLVGSWVRSMSYWMAPQEQRMWCRVKGGLAAGLQFELSPRWETAAWEGSYERGTQDVLRKCLRPGSVLYDIGAGVGYFSCVAARLGARVYAFEPNEANAGCLLQHAKMNHLESAIELVRMAASSKGGSVWLQQVPELRGHPNSRVVEASGETCARVETTTLDDFVLSHPAPAVCKVDVEGYEAEVLKGAEHLFSGVRPCLICEVHDRQNEEFLNGWLVGKQYAIHWLEKSLGQRFPVHLFAHPVEARECGHAHG